MKIEILGACCSKCKQLYENAQTAAKELDARIEVIKVEDMQIIMDYGVMTIPAIVIDGVVKAAGRVPSVDELKKWISGK